MNTIPLVSVSIISYNSAEFIVETLDSVKNQTYPNIELIVSDDKSTDNTVEIVKKWISENSARFHQCKIVETYQNTGPAGNANRAISAASGTWVKLFAADDLLKPNFIETNMVFVEQYPDVKVFFSRGCSFGDKTISNLYDSYFSYGYFLLSNRERYLYSLSKNRVYGIGIFMNKEYVQSIGMYDESFPFIEDWPFYIKLFLLNAPIYFINKELVSYRAHGSLSQGGSPIFKKNYKMVLDFVYNLQMKENIIYRVYAKFCKCKRDKAGQLISFFFAVLIRITPHYYYYKYLDWKIEYFTKKINASFEN